VKIAFVHIVVKSGSIYVKPRTKWSPAHSTHIIKILFVSRNTSFLADRTNGRAYATVLRLSVRPSVVCRLW